MAFCLFCLVVGARWAIYSRFGTDLPEMDQWDAEGLAMFLPRSIGQFHFPDFFRPHNEHRVVLTRFLAYGLTLANGEWDQRLEAAVNAVLPGVIAIGFWLLAVRRVGRRWQIALYLTIAAFYALPVAWENMLSGFDSQQFFLIGLALGTIATLPFAEPYAPGWWGGAVCAVLSLGSMASGLFAAVIVAGMLLFQLWRGGRQLRSAGPALVVCAAAAAVGIMAIMPSAEGLKAQSIGDFFMTLVRALGWPAFDQNWGFFALVLALPWALVSWRLLKDRTRVSDRWTEFLSAAGAWVVLQALAMAYARGFGGPTPASRYVDTLIVGVIVNLLCLHAVAKEGWLPAPCRHLMPAFIGIWAGLLILGGGGVAYHAFASDLPPHRLYHFYCEQNVRNYLITEDPAYLRHNEIPYPSDQALKQDLDYPGIAGILPVSVRVPTPLATAGSLVGEPGFLRSDSRLPERLNQLPRRGAGISPATPVLKNAVTWGDFGRSTAGTPTVWRSEPLRTSVGRWLKFEVAGEIGRPGLALELREAKSDRVVATVVPDKRPGASWRSAYVHAPAGEFVIAARDETSAGWMAFSEPREMGAGSYWAWQILRRADFLVGAAGLLAGGLLLGVIQSGRQSRTHR